MTGSTEQEPQAEEVKATTPAEETIPLQDDAEARKDDPAGAEADPESAAGSPSRSESKLQRGRRSIKKKTQYIIREKHGPMRNAIPYMPMPVAIILCVLNILPGVGTFLSAFFTLCCPVPGMKDEPKTKPFSYCLLAAFVQIVLAIIIVGWILSFYWGVMFIVISWRKGEEPVSVIERYEK
ncbi:protein stum homolog [Branchiostoma floridae]|uniref:Protein stum homolog n=2 Tax=Branchiostoma floridae TaxID=7739 RepID=A0A9J7MUU4_BRAFL|nr:protein stum homolog [Branchiostoma floridae]